MLMKSIIKIFRCSVYSVYSSFWDSRYSRKDDFKNQSTKEILGISADVIRPVILGISADVMRPVILGISADVMRPVILGISADVMRPVIIGTLPPILAKKIYDIFKFQIFKKIMTFRNILNIRRPYLDCIRHFQRATSQGYIIWPIGN